MRWIPLLLIISFVLISCDDTAETADAADVETEQQIIVIENVTVIPMDRERTVPAQTVVVQDGQIVEMGDHADVEVPEGATRISGVRRYLMPGLAEMHGHLPGPDNEEFRDRTLFLFVANGITYVRGMQGAPDHPHLRDAIANGERFGPMLRVASPGFGGGSLTVDEARSRVQQYAEDGYDLLKIFEGLQPEVYEAIAEEAHAQNIPFGGHVSDEIGLLRSLEAGQSTIDHLENYVEALRSDEAPDDFPAIFGAGVVAPYADRDRIPELVDATLQSSAAVVPTMLLWDAFFGDRSVGEYRDEYQELQYVPDDMVEDWEQGLRGIRGNFEPEQGAMVRELRGEILTALHEAGVPVLLGSDAPQIFNVPGFSTHREMQFMQDEVGMSPYDVLVTGTRGVAEFYDQADEFGTVEVGQRADLILVNGNPLTDVSFASNIHGVILQGEWLSREAIDAELDRFAER